MSRNVYSTDDLFAEEQTPLLTQNKSMPLDEMESGDGYDQPTGNQLNTFFGVFVPCLLSIFGVILFERIGYAVGQAGVLGTIAMLSCGFVAVTLTALSISAVATNGKVRGGGAYFLISRVLGPEFGGTTGIVLYASNVAACCMYILGFVEALLGAFGTESGTIANVFPESYWFQYLYATVLMFLCFIVVVAGAKLFAASSFIIWIVLMASIFSVFISLVFGAQNPSFGFYGFNDVLFKQNAFPDFVPAHGHTDGFFSIFALLFPACTGIMAGANMSGDLRNPSKAIPNGTLWSLTVSYVVYILLVVCIAFSYQRQYLLDHYLILQYTSFFPPIVVGGIFAATVSSALGSFIGASRILQAVARDKLIGGDLLSMFGKGVGKGDEPVAAVLLSYALVQAMLLIGELNLVAPIVTVFFLAAYAITNAACLGPALTSAPNWRPSFRYFRWYSALIGALMCFGGTFLVNSLVAFITVVVMISLFIFIHYTAPPTEWGDLSQALIYHQVRKYLLMLDSRKNHVKYWRPQVLLCVSSLRTDYCLIAFANNLKKSGLFVLGHVLQGAVDERAHNLLELQRSWLRFVDVTGVKAFVEFAVAQSVREGLCNLFLQSGLGGMRPNIVLFGFIGDESANDASWKQLPPNQRRHDLDQLFKETQDDKEKAASAFGSNSEFVGSMHDALLLGKSVGVARGFGRLALQRFEQRGAVKRKGWIDVYAMPVSGSTNVETLTMTLQLACVLSRSKTWKGIAKLRVIAPIVDNDYIGEAHETIQSLLKTLRIDARLMVMPVGDEREQQEFVRLSPLDQAKKMASLMRRVSTSKDTLVVFTSLPPPPAVKMTNSRLNDPAHFSEMRRVGVAEAAMHVASQAMGLGSIDVHGLDAESYFEVISALSHNLPPILLVHGTALTVTAQL